jgi:hypothetical protein
MDEEGKHSSLGQRRQLSALALSGGGLFVLLAIALVALGGVLFGWKAFEILSAGASSIFEWQL